MKTKVVIIVTLGMILLTGCTGFSKKDNALTIYKDLDGKETYEKLVDKMNSEVNYIKYVIHGEQENYSDKSYNDQNEIYKIDDTLGIVSKSQDLSKESGLIYMVTTANEKYELSNEDSDNYILVKNDEGIDDTEIYQDMYREGSAKILDIERKENKEKIILSITSIQEGEVSSFYLVKKYTIGEDGLLESTNTKIYLDEEYKSELVEIKENVYCDRKKHTADFEKELKLIKSLDGASEQEVEEKVVFSTY